MKLVTYFLLIITCSSFANGFASVTIKCPETSGQINYGSNISTIDGYSWKIWIEGLRDTLMINTKTDTAYYASVRNDSYNSSGRILQCNGGSNSNPRILYTFSTTYILKDDTKFCLATGRSFSCD